MDAGFLDMLHDAGNADVLAVGDGVDVDLDRVAQILVDQDRAVARDLDRSVDISVELGRPVDHLHGAAAQHIGGPRTPRVADALRHRERLLPAAGHAVARLPAPQLVDPPGAPPPVLAVAHAVRWPRT